MKIAVTAEGGTLDARACPTFGRSPYLVFCETETGEVEALPNPATDADHGAGVKAAETVVAAGASVVCTGRMGPNAWEVCEAAGVKVLAASGTTVQEVLDRHREGRLAPLGPSEARGRRGGGRGRGRGR